MTFRFVPPRHPAGRRRPRPRPAGALLLLAVCAWLVAAGAAAAPGDAVLARAFRNHVSNIEVTGAGVVERILRDDDNGIRHQRFILRLASGQTLLVAHNIDLAPRVAPLSVGDRVRFKGVYEWNAQGGVLHFTHHDPEGRHAPGWLECHGRRFH
jgi:hypothetical protein